MFQGLPRVSRLPISPPASIVIFVLPLSPATIVVFVLTLPAAPVRILRLSPPLRLLFLNVRLWRLLLTLYSTWLLPTILYCRSVLLGLPMFLYCRSTLLLRGLTLGFLLPLVFHRSRFLPSTLGGCRRFLHRLLLDMLADYLVSRLVAVTPAAQLMLLLYLAGIVVPCILALVGGARRTCRD